MKVVFQEPTHPTYLAARRLLALSKDELFTPVELAAELGITVEETARSICQLDEWDVFFEWDGEDERPPPSQRQYGLREHALAFGREYEVLCIEYDSFRIIEDGCGRFSAPVLFHSSWFRVTDPTRPSFWICRTDEDGFEHCAPPGWGEIGFFEDYFDRVEEVYRRFWEDLRRYFPETAAKHPNRP